VGGGDAVPWITGCGSAHPGRDLLREVPTWIREKGVGRSSGDSLTLQATPSPFTGVRRASNRDGAVAEHSPAGIAQVVIFPAFLRASASPCESRLGHN